MAGASRWRMNSLSNVAVAASIPWDFNNKFWIELRGKFVDNFDKNNLLSANNLNVNLETFDITDITGDTLEMYAAERWLQAPGRINSVRVTMKFRDSCQGEYYRLFTSAMKRASRMYPEDQFLSIDVYLEPNWADENNLLLATIDKCILTNISGITLDNGSRNQVTNFTVVFNCPTITPGTQKSNASRASRSLT